MAEIQGLKSEEGQDRETGMFDNGRAQVSSVCRYARATAKYDGSD